MAYNLRSRSTSITSEGSSVAMRSEGLNLSPVEFVGHGPDLLGLTVIEGSPEALQTAATSAPFTIEIDEQTETPHNITIVPTPALDLGADNSHPASSVYGAGAAGSGPPPSGPGAAPSTISSFRDPSILELEDLSAEACLYMTCF